MWTEDKSDVECKAIKANRGSGLSAAGSSSAVSVRACVYSTHWLRLQGGMGSERSWQGGERELFDCFVYTVRPLLELGQ